MKRKKLTTVLVTTLICGGMLEQLTLVTHASDYSKSSKVNYDSAIVRKEKDISLDKLFKLNGNAVKIDDNTVQLTKALGSQKGAISGKGGINLNKDFSLNIDVNLGNDINGADGIGIAFHKDSVGQIGEYGGGLGIAGLSDGIGFELDTFWNAPEDEDSSFGHDKMKAAHAGFVSTKSSNQLTALAPMQYINFASNTFKNLKLAWDASANIMTADYDGKHWEVSPNVDKTSLYTFIIAASTGNSFNEHMVRINDFKAAFTSDIFANNISINQGDEFDPFDSKIGLKATDPIDGDITDKIKVKSNDVNTSVSGNYEVTYEVTNTLGETSTKNITVTVESEPTWENGSPNGWKAFAGEDVNIIKDPENALFGDFVYHSDQQAAIYKIFDGINSFFPGNYRVTIYAKGNTSTPPSLPLKVSLKEDISSGNSRILLLANPLSSGEKVEKGFYKVSANVTLSANETTPLITIENYQGGYITGIYIEPID